MNLALAFLMESKPAVKRLVIGLVLAAEFLVGTSSGDQTQWSRSDATLEPRMRELWDAQATWTRMYVVSTLGDLPDTSFARARLFRCPVDFEAAVGPYYGKQVAKDFSSALGRHLNTLVAVVRATRQGDAAALAALKSSWRTDAESTAAALGRINPGWSTPAFRELLDVYLQLTDREVVLRARGDFSADIGNFGEAHELALQLGDVMARGILSQFPTRPVPGGR